MAFPGGAWQAPAAPPPQLSGPRSSCVRVRTLAGEQCAPPTARSAPAPPIAYPAPALLCHALKSTPTNITSLLFLHVCIIYFIENLKFTTNISYAWCKKYKSLAVYLMTATSRLNIVEHSLHIKFQVIQANKKDIQ